MKTGTPEFDEIATAYESSQGGPVASGGERRKLYGLYRQATHGDLDEAPPGFFAFEDQLKFRAWKALRGMAKEEAKRRFVTLAKKLGYRDPGDSPVAWISTETWRREESWTNPDQEQRYPCIHTPEMVVVDATQCESPMTMAVSDSVATPPRGKPEEHLERLEDTPETYAFQLHSPRWPICCERLAVLVGYRGVDAAFGEMIDRACFLPQDRERWYEGVVGTNSSDEKLLPYGEEQLRNEDLLFHCHDCGTLYVSSQEL